MRSRLTWLRHTTNAKTGDIPTAYVGRSRAEAWASCYGCALRGEKSAGSLCYAWSGWTGRTGIERVLEAAENNPERHTVEWALAKLTPAQRAVRIGALGDPGMGLTPADFTHASSYCRARGLAVLAYTHHWRRPVVQWLREDAMASCDSPREAEQALAQGWRPAAILPVPVSETFVSLSTGESLLVCPAQRMPESITCNTCRLCDPKNPAWSRVSFSGIAFNPHGAHMTRAGRVLPLASRGLFDA